MSAPDLSEDLVDFAVAAYREHGRWEVQELTPHHLVDVETLADALRRLPGEAGALALVAVDDDWFVLVRVLGPATRVLLSDAEAEGDWGLAESVLDHLGHHWSGDPDETDDEGRYVPPGDLDLLEDLGVDVDDLLDVVNDDDDELDLVDLLADLADQLGFGAQFDDAVGLTPA